MTPIIIEVEFYQYSIYLHYIYLNRRYYVPCVIPIIIDVKV